MKKFLPILKRRAVAEEDEALYGLHKLLWDIRRYPDIKDAYQKNPDAVLDNYEIDEPFRGFMKTLDFKSMYERGVNPYLLYFCAIQLEIDRAQYYAQIRGEDTQ